MIAFSRRFGALDQAPIQENGRRFVDGLPEIYVVSNVIENGVAIGSLGAGEAVWHTDMSCTCPIRRRAASSTRCRCRPTGGDTSFCIDVRRVGVAASSRRCARRRCPAACQARRHVQQRRLPARRRRSERRPAHRARHAASARLRATIGNRTTASIPWPTDATRGSRGCRSTSRMRCSIRSGRSPRPTRLTWSHQWRPSDLVLWDNRCVMHRRDAFDPGTRRVMHRTQIKGEAQPKPAVA